MYIVINSVQYDARYSVKEIERQLRILEDNSDKNHVTNLLKYTIIWNPSQETFRIEVKIRLRLQKLLVTFDYN